MAELSLLEQIAYTIQAILFFALVAVVIIVTVAPNHAAKLGRRLLPGKPKHDAEVEWVTTRYESNPSVTASGWPKDARLHKSERRQDQDADDATRLAAQSGFISDEEMKSSTDASAGLRGQEQAQDDLPPSSSTPRASRNSSAWENGATPYDRPSGIDAAGDPEKW